MFAIFGAIRYNIWLVAANIAYLVISFVAGIAVNVAASNSNSDYSYNVVFNVVVGLIVLTLFIYPHVMFVREVRSGTMTKDNYDKEEQSCCCV
jgi:membrane protein YdbS with pleckstrin-like domain